MRKNMIDEAKADAIRFGLKIPVGKDKAISGRELGRRWGVYSAVSTRRIVNELRRQRMPICSDSNGYWLSTDSQELIECANKIYLHAKEEMATARNLALAEAMVTEKASGFEALFFNNCD